MAEITYSQHPAAASAASSSVRLAQSCGIALAGSLLVALCAHVSVPLVFTPVPVTFQTFAVLFLGLALGPRLAFASLALYLLEGAAGLPVFSPHGLGGIPQLLGPTGGYLFSYPFAAALAGYLYHRAPRRFSTALLSAGLASVVILTVGTVWLSMLAHMGPRVVLAQAVAPFLPGDVLKVCAAAAAIRFLPGRHRKGQVPPDPESGLYSQSNLPL